MIRVILDVNCWISSLMTEEFQYKTDMIFGNPNIEILVSENLFAEINRKKNKKKFIRYFQPWEADDLMERLRATAEMVDVRSVVHVCRDPKDDYLLALAKDGEADYLITGDKDLLSLNPYGKTKIMPITDFVIETA